MADDKEVTIRITGRNLTADEFEKARKGLAGVRSEAERAKPAAMGFRDAMSGVTKVAGLLGIGLGVGAIVNFGKGVFDAASRIVDLSSAMGVSIEAAQRFKFAAQQGGATVEDVGRSISFMNRVLAEGNNSTKAALDAAGLSFDSIRAMKPEDAFLAITDAVKDIRDPMLQAEVATRLFGKGAIALLPQIKDGFRAAADAAEVMKEETVRRLEAAQQSWENFWNKVTIISGEALGTMAEVIEANAERNRKTDLLQKFALKENISLTEAMARVYQRSAGDQERFFRTGSFEAKKSADVNLSLAGAYKAVGESLSDKDRRDQAAAKAAAAHAKAIRDQADELSGAKLQRQVQDLAAAVSNLTAEQLRQPDTMRRVGDAARKLWEDGARLTPELFAVFTQTQRLIPVTDGLSKELEGLGTSFKMAYDSSVPFIGMFQGLKGLDLPELAMPTMPKVSTPFLQSVFGTSQQFGQSLASTILSAVQGGGNAFHAAGGMVGSSLMAGWAKHLTTAKDGATAAISGWLGGALNSVLPMVGSLLGPLAGKISGFLTGLFDRNKGRDLVKEFAASFGGFDQLHAKLNTLGAAGEQLWIRLTQGVGRNNPEQAKAAIAAINEAFGAQESKAERLQAAIEKYGISWEQLGPKARNAKLNELAQALVDDFNLLAEAEIDVGVISEKMAADVNDFLHRAMRTGQEIPASMRPMLEKMFEFGMLTDESGKKLESLEGLTFAQTVTQGFKGITDELRNIAGILVGQLPQAIDGVFRGIPRQIDIEVRGHRTGEWTGGETESPNPNEGFPRGTPNLDFLNFGRRTRTELHGEEAVIPRSGVGQLAAQIAAALAPALQPAFAGVDGSTTLEVVLPIGRQVQRYQIDLDKERRRAGVATERRTLTDRSY